MSVALRAEGLRCELGGRVVVDDVSLQVSAGEVLALLGPNGAGKTTLMRMLCGALTPRQGRVLLDDRDVTGLPLHRRARLGLGYLPQDASAFTGLSVRVNVEAALELAGVPPARRRGKADELLELFELEPLAGRKPATLSGGERRRLELARLLAIEPRVVLLDEPFAGLDPLAIDQLSRRIELLTSEKGVGVLLADHYVARALTICRRGCILIDGRLVLEGTPAELLSDEAARQGFFGHGLQLGKFGLGATGLHASLDGSRQEAVPRHQGE